MGWFSKNDKSDIVNQPKDMSPLEAVTHLCAAIQLADGQTNYEEKEPWLNTIKELFPDFSENRAERFLMDAQTIINKKVGNEKINYVIDVSVRIRSLLNEDQIKTLAPKIANIIEADGMVMTSETDIAKVIEDQLGINIAINENL
tara:strand:- start:625 stop:1059 length:435 start_codon:yes stop_codon:yes gene_type:complete